MSPGSIDVPEDHHDVSAFDDMPCGLLSMQLDGVILRANKTFAVMINRPEHETLTGLKVQSLLAASARVAYQTQVQPMLMTCGLVNETTLQFNCGTGPPLSALVNLKLKRAVDGAPLLVHAAVFDVTGRAAIEHEVREAEARSQQLAAIVASSNDAIMSLGPDLEILSWNTGAAQLFGYEEVEAVGRRADELFVPEEHLSGMRETYRALLRGQTVTLVESRRRHKNGHLIDVEVSAAPMFDRSGRVVAFSAVLRDIGERRRATQALRASHAALQAALDVASMASWGWDETRHVKIWSAEALALAGLPPETIMTKPLFLSLLHPDDLGAYEAAWAAGMDPHGSRTYKLDYRIRRASDGAVRLISSKAAVEFEGEVAVRVVGALRDITEERAAQDHIVLLLDEMNHRAKNLLAIVQIIAQQTAKHSDPGSFIDRLSDRLKALSTNQDLLIKNSWKSAELVDLVRSQLSPFRDLLDSRIRVDGPPSKLRAEAAQAIGMALHELATNAVKHGALSDASGKVQITWTIDKAQEPLFRMFWLESNGPVVRPPTRQGFGQVVLKQMVASAVKGQAELAYVPEGVTWLLRAPVASVLDGDAMSDGRTGRALGS